MKKIAYVSILAIAACGPAVGTSSHTSKQNEPLGDPAATDAAAVANAWAVASEDDLPACDASRKGQLYFIESDGTFRVCRSDGWMEIDLRGKDGEDGTNGKDGKAGKDGAAGATGATGAQGITGATGATGISGGEQFDIVVKLACTKADGDWLLKYTAIQFSNDMVYVSCVASTSSTQVSYSTIYASSQLGSDNGYCAVTWDVEASPNFGRWEFTYDPLQATYSKPGSDADGFTSSFDVSTDCTTVF